MSMVLAADPRPATAGVSRVECRRIARPEAARSQRAAVARLRRSTESTVTVVSGTPPVTMNLIPELSDKRSMPFEIDWITIVPSSAPTSSRGRRTG